MVLSYHASMGVRKAGNPQGELVQGTLDMLVLKVLSLRSMHGWGIAQRIRQVSDEILRVEEGSLYPALRRLELEGLIDAEWGMSENNRRARFYRITRAGHRRLTDERQHWSVLASAI